MVAYGMTLENKLKNDKKPEAAGIGKGSRMPHFKRRVLVF
jgi:hypothetical protein